MNNEEKSIYTTPSVVVVEINSEKGFAASDNPAYQNGGTLDWD